jgi:hypothetical protein
MRVRYNTFEARWEVAKTDGWDATWRPLRGIEEKIEVILYVLAHPDEDYKY